MLSSASKKVASAKYREFAHSDPVADQGLHGSHLATGQEAADEFLESGRGKSTALDHRIPGSIGGMPGQLLGVEEVATAVASRATRCGPRTARAESTSRVTDCLAFTFSGWLRSRERCRRCHSLGADLNPRNPRMANAEMILGIVALAIGVCALCVAIRTNPREKWAIWATAILVAIAALAPGPILLWMGFKDDLREHPPLIWIESRGGRYS